MFILASDKQSGYVRLCINVDRIDYIEENPHDDTRSLIHFSNKSIDVDCSLNELICVIEKSK